MPRFSLALVLVFTALPAFANDRHFTHTYESGVLPEGGRELEVWTTPRLGRDDYYARFDQRLEFEVGLTNRLQTAFYLNFTSVSQNTPDGRANSFSFGGVSSEWKYKLTDPVADAIGFALYGEVTGSTDELELEAKLIFDKAIGRALFAANIVGEYELEFGFNDTKKELKLEIDLAAAYFLTEHLALGLELRSVNEFENAEEFEDSALFAGPVIAYATKGWWMALSVLPKLPALKKGSADAGRTLILSHQEKVVARLLFSFHL